MRLLFAIPHFFDPRRGASAGSRSHGSLQGDAEARARALGACLAALHQLYGRSQYMIDIGRRVAEPANDSGAHEVTAVVCTSGSSHLLERIPGHLYTHHETAAEPPMLGFECQAVMRDGLGEYDYLCYLEDDLILHDPQLFVKLAWFSAEAGEDAVLQPNRYEVAVRGPVAKCYVDGDLAPRVTRRFGLADEPPVTATAMGSQLSFRRALNPHSGCHFLSAGQFERWAARPDFLDRDTSFIGPLESAATLGLIRAFRVYKPDRPNAAFLEIQHAGTGFLGLIGTRGRPGPH